MLYEMKVFYRSDFILLLKNKLIIVQADYSLTIKSKAEVVTYPF